MQLEQSKTSLTKIPLYGNKSNVLHIRAILNFSELYHKAVTQQLNHLPSLATMLKNWKNNFLLFITSSLFFQHF